MSQRIPKPVLVTEPANAILQVADVKNFLRVDGTDDDNLIEVLISAVTSRLESFLDRKLITQTWDIFFDDFPCTGSDKWWDGVREGSISMLRGQESHIDLPFGPLQSVTYLKTYDEDNTDYTYDSVNYTVDTANHFGRVSLKIGAVWPTTILRPTNGALVRGVFGYGADDTSIPDAILQAAKLTIAKLYENRGDDKEGEAQFTMPATAQFLLEPYRLIKVGR